jgi:hypothetical protein
MNSILIGLIVLAIIYYFMHVNSRVCDGNSDCSVHNNQDEKSSCDPICSKQGKVFKDYVKGQCECENPIQLKSMNEHVATSKATPFVADIELYTNVTDPTTILPSNTPDDTPFNNRDLLQKHEKDRFNSLIFG